MVLRFFPTFSEEIHNIYDAMKLRGIALSWKNVFTRPVLILEAIASEIVFGIKESLVRRYGKRLMPSVLEPE